MRILILSALLPFAIAASPPTAPLPPHWEMDLRYEAEPPPSLGPLRGVYGRGVSDPVPELASDFLQSQRQPVCRGDAAAQQAWLERLGGFKAQFWFYGTRQQAVLFLRGVVLPSPNGCDQPPVYVHKIERALIADGIFHLIEVAADGRTDLSESRRVGASDEEDRLSFGFGLLYAMVARDAGGLAIGPDAGAENDRVAGIPVRCRSAGFGYMFSRTCVSRSGPTRGMPILIETSDDSQRLAWTEFLELTPEAMLDGHLFDFELGWMPREGSDRTAEDRSPQPPR